MREWLATGRRVQRPVRQEVMRVRFVGLESDADAALDGLAVIIQRLGSLQPHQPGLTLDVPLPAAHRDCPAALH